MKKALILSASTFGLSAALSLTPVAVTPAAACQNWDDVARTCRDEVKSSIKEVFRSKPDEGTKRATSVGGAVRDCINCATDAIKNGVKKID